MINLIKLIETYLFDVDSSVEQTIATKLGVKLRNPKSGAFSITYKIRGGKILGISKSREKALIKLNMMDGTYDGLPIPKVHDVFKIKKNGEYVYGWVMDYVKTGNSNQTDQEKLVDIFNKFFNANNDSRFYDLHYNNIGHYKGKVVAFDFYPPDIPSSIPKNINVRILD